MPTLARFLLLAAGAIACSRSPRRETAAPAESAGALDSGAAPTVFAEAPRASAATPPDAAPPTPQPSASSAPVKVNVKIVTIGMHVAGGPFDEPTKEPFKKAVEPHFPEIAQCWGRHVTHPPKAVDVGVDLLIEAGGGRAKTSNHRSTLPKDADASAFLPCVVAVFESVEFPKLDRGRTGVSYSLRFTP